MHFVYFAHPWCASPVALLCCLLFVSSRNYTYSTADMKAKLYCKCFS